jgi:hypothetical protein
MVEMSEVYNVWLKFIERASEGLIQRGVDVPILMVGHVYAPYFDAANVVILLVANRGIW